MKKKTKGGGSITTHPSSIEFTIDHAAKQPLYETPLHLQGTKLYFGTNWSISFSQLKVTDKWWKLLLDHQEMLKEEDINEPLEQLVIKFQSFDRTKQFVCTWDMEDIGPSQAARMSSNARQFLHKFQKLYSKWEMKQHAKQQKQQDASDQDFYYAEEDYGEPKRRRLTVKPKPTPTYDGISLLKRSIPPRVTPLSTKRELGKASSHPRRVYGKSPSRRIGSSWVYPEPTTLDPEQQQEQHDEYPQEELGEEEKALEMLESLTREQSWNKPIKKKNKYDKLTQMWAEKDLQALHSENGLSEEEQEEGNSDVIDVDKDMDVIVVDGSKSAANDSDDDIKEKQQLSHKEERNEGVRLKSRKRLKQVVTTEKQQDDSDSEFEFDHTKPQHSGKKLSFLGDDSDEEEEDDHGGELSSEKEPIQSSIITPFTNETTPDTSTSTRITDDEETASSEHFSPLPSVEGEAGAVPNINTKSKITSFFSQTANLELTNEQQEARDRSAGGASTPPFAKRSSTDDVGSRTPPPSSRTRSVTSSGVRRRLSPSKTTTMTTPRRLNFQSSSAELALGPNRSTQKTPVKNPYQKLKSKPEERPHGGLRNLGNTCYLNATLQLLFSISGFLQDLKDVHDTLKMGNSSSNLKLPLTGALLEVAWNFGLVNGSPKPNGNNVVDPSRVKHAMDALTDKFSGYEQRDAHEFASGLIDLLHEELSAATESSSKKCDVVSEETSQGEKEVTAEKKLRSRLKLPTDTYFRLDVKVCLTCDHCKYTRCKEEMYRHLSIGVGADEEESWSVEKGLKQFFRPEVREIKCEKCDLGMTATQTTHIIKSPEVLLLHLKRFIITQMTPRDDESVPRICVRKNKARVTCKDFISIEDFHEVNMSESVSADDNKCNPYQYVLNGVVRHFGGSAVSGHYTVDSLRIKPGTSNEQQHEGQVINKSTKEWVSFDDSVSSYSSWKSMSSERNERSSYLFLFSLHD